MAHLADDAGTDHRGATRTSMTAERLVDVVRDELDRHPRVRGIGRGAGEILYLIVWFVTRMIEGGFVGALAASALYATVLFTIDGDFVLEKIFVRWMWIAAIGAGIGMAVKLLRLSTEHDPNREYRTRRELAQDLAAQAVVAYRLGYDSVEARLTLARRSWIRRSVPIGYWGGAARGIDSRDVADRSYDSLVIQLANPSLTTDSFASIMLRDEWTEQIARTADQVVVHRAASGRTDSIDAGELIADAAQLARSITDEVGPEPLEAIATEIRLTGRLRSGRLVKLLGSPAAVDEEAVPA